ncbi:MAG: c-type cytochrome [Gammaproteobacteria bacterium]|nr:c-type cytochrome [Gammaproteobacteria bacterium]
MKARIAMILAASLLTLDAVADEPRFKWSYDTLRLIASGDPARGEAVAKEHKCSKCHGDTGISDEDDTPSIAGQARSYQFKQLMDYKHSTRDEKTMTKRARKLTPEEMADLSAFYEAQAPEQPPGREPHKLATEGDKSRLLLSCDVCHGKDGVGYGMESPALAGQKPVYFLDTMMAFREGDRENDAYGRMRFIANQLTEDEIKALAAYYSMPPRPKE